VVQRGFTIAGAAVTGSGSPQGHPRHPHRSNSLAASKAAADRSRSVGARHVPRSFYRAPLNKDFLARATVEAGLMNADSGVEIMSTAAKWIEPEILM
jgi:hypothetical protein